MKVVLTIAAITTILSIGCSTSKDEIQTIEYYKTHINEAKKVVEKCKTKESMTEDERIECASAERAISSAETKRPVKGNEPHIKTW